MYKIQVNNNKELEITGTTEKTMINDQVFEWDVIKVSDNYFHIIHNNQTYKAEVIKAGPDSKNFVIKVNGQKHTITLKDKTDILLQKMGFVNTLSNEVKEVKAPMPGLILDIIVTEGAPVKKGDPLLILEAMKMENVLKSPGEGVVKKITVKKGNSVEKNQILIQF